MNVLTDARNRENRPEMVESGGRTELAFHRAELCCIAVFAALGTKRLFELTGKYLDDVLTFIAFANVLSFSFDDGHSSLACDVEQPKWFYMISSVGHMKSVR